MTGKPSGALVGTCVQHLISCNAKKSIDKSAGKEVQGLSLNESARCGDI